jgi:hypothetical protein
MEQTAAAKLPEGRESTPADPGQSNHGQADFSVKNRRSVNGFPKSSAGSQSDSLPTVTQITVSAFPGTHS